jgi:hypothetical protein
MSISIAIQEIPHHYTTAQLGREAYSAPRGPTICMLSVCHPCLGSVRITQGIFPGFRQGILYRYPDMLSDMSVACYSRTLSRGSVIVSLSFSQVSDREYYQDMLAHCLPCTLLRFVLFEPSLIKGFAKEDVTVIIAQKYRPTIPVQGIAIQCKLIDACPRKSAHDKRT